MLDERVHGGECVIGMTTEPDGVHRMHRRGGPSGSALDLVEVGYVPTSEVEVGQQSVPQRLI
jgi:hypothetical protein